MFYKRSQFDQWNISRWLLYGLASLCLSTNDLTAMGAQKKGLPPPVERIVRWLPEDTETLIVAQTVTLPDLDEKDTFKWRDVGVGLATGDLELLNKGKYSQPLRRRKIAYIVNGERNFDGVTKFGGLRREGCAILVFSDDLGNAATEWVGILREGAEEVRTMVGREVFVFPSPTVMERRVKRTKWQGTYFVLLNLNTVLCASSDRYLESVLKRIDDAPAVRAFPDDLPEWKRVDLDAPAWMLRHILKAQERIHVVGATAAFRADGFDATFIPRIGKLIDSKAIETEWLPDGLFGTQVLRDQLKMRRQPDGTIALSSRGNVGDDNLWFVWQLDRLIAFDLFQIEK